MKGLLLLTAAFTTVATAAFGQIVATSLGKPVVFKDASGSDADSRTLAGLITRALDRSRYLHLTPMADKDTIELEAPYGVVKDVGGTRITVRYEITPSRSTGHEYSVTCTTTRLQVCADTIIERTERVARGAAG